jgi:hypothetical protein
LVDHLPHRVLPISAEPPKDIQFLIDEEYSQIATLLTPGRRRRPDARARIRSLLAMEAHVAPEALVSEKDVTRVERAVRAGRPRGEVFPRLQVLETNMDGEGVQVSVRFSKSGTPVRLVGVEENVEAAAIREIDLQRKFHWSPTELAKKLNLTGRRALALRRYLGVDDDATCRYDFVFGSQKHVRYSDNAFTKMRDALLVVDMDEIWREHGPRRTPRAARAAQTA